jgi:anhydro-N-acetylmuramic acid kinase
MFHSPSEDRVLIHLGGYATLVWLPAQGGPRQCVGFQAGPCGLLLDGLMRYVTGGKEVCDVGGKHAVQGRCIEPILEKWLAHPRLQRRPPKSWPSGGHAPEFIEQALHSARELQRSAHDVLCTATHWSARMIVDGCRKFLPWPPQRVLVSGGGARNGFLWRLLEQGLDGIPLEKTDAHGVPTDARKALAFAALGALSLDGVPINLPSVTGAAGPRLLGQWTPGTSANWARCLNWMASQTQPLAAAA